MIKPNKLEQLAKQITDSLPEGIKQLGSETEKRIKQTVQNQLQKLDLVSKEEFDVQMQVLLRTREKLELLEKRVAELEAAQQDQSND